MMQISTAELQQLNQLINELISSHNHARIANVACMESFTLINDRAPLDQATKDAVNAIITPEAKIIGQCLSLAAAASNHPDKDAALQVIHGICRAFKDAMSIIGAVKDGTLPPEGSTMIEIQTGVHDPRTCPKCSNASDFPEHFDEAGNAIEQEDQTQ